MESEKLTTEEKPEVKVDEALVSPDDGRKVPWYVHKIRELEEKLADGNGYSRNVIFAEGFFTCLSKYQILSKLQRRRLKERLEKEGPGAVKSLRASKFNIPVGGI